MAGWRSHLRVTQETLLITALTWAVTVERVTRIELALSAWEAARSRLATDLNCRLWRSGLTVADPSSPWLMAR